METKLWPGNLLLPQSPTEMWSSQCCLRDKVFDWPCQITRPLCSNFLWSQKLSREVNFLHHSWQAWGDMFGHQAIRLTHKSPLGPSRNDITQFQLLAWGQHHFQHLKMVLFKEHWDNGPGFSHNIWDKHFERPGLGSDTHLLYGCTLVIGLCFPPNPHVSWVCCWGGACCNAELICSSSGSNWYLIFGFVISTYLSTQTIEPPANSCLVSKKMICYALWNSSGLYGLCGVYLKA